MSDTIFALATPLGKSGVAVVRVSGKKVPEIITLLTQKTLPNPRIAALRSIYNHANNQIIDKALLIYFKAPNSFTGEDLLELHIHGSKIVIKELYQILASLDKVRMAEAGEFTKRAFYNQKVDLTETEGIIDLINAETKEQHRQALQQLEGKNKDVYENWRADILKILAYIEATIDFSEEDIPQNVFNYITAQSQSLAAKIKNSLNDNRVGEKIREGFLIAILGKPNVGKSSLINLIAKRDVAIVSEYAGTTRDIIEVQLDLHGYPIILADTAGLRETDNPIEQEGINRAKNKAKEADLKLMLYDASDFVSEPHQEALIDENTLIVVNKIDKKNYQTKLDDKIISISALNNQGINNLLDRIIKHIEDKYPVSNSSVITRVRHRQLLEQALDLLEKSLEDKAIELKAEDIRMAAKSIGKITGKIEVEELLNKIFKDFCIGK